MEPLTPRGPDRPERDGRFLRGELHAESPPRRPGATRLSRLAWLVAAALPAVGIWHAVASGRTPELELERILVEGNSRLTDGEIRELIEVDGTTNIVTLDLGEVRRKLLRSSWIRDVELRRVLPGTLTLHIVERTPVAIAALEELALLAEDGTLLGPLPPYEDVRKLVVVRGLVAEDGLRVSQERAAVAGRIASALRTDEQLLSLVSEVDVEGGAESVRLRLRDRELALLADESTMMERLVQMAPLLSGIEERLPAVELLDLRFQKRVYLRMKETVPGGTPPSTPVVPGGAPF